MTEEFENGGQDVSVAAPAMTADQVFGATEYFEVESTSVGARFAVWVTTAPTYAQDDQVDYPVLYVTDGNYSVGQTAPLAVMQSDLALPIAPYLQVTIGYAGADAQDWGRVRNRDLVPPGEPVPPAMRGSLEMAVDNGLMTRAEAEAYLEDLSNTRADAFLTFITDELHPEISRRYRVAPEGHGLFGYSYGGLFSLYALLTGCPLFAAYGAGSPGVALSREHGARARREAPGPDRPAAPPHHQRTRDDGRAAHLPDDRARLHPSRRVPAIQRVGARADHAGPRRDPPHRPPACVPQLHAHLLVESRRPLSGQGHGGDRC